MFPRGVENAVVAERDGIGRWREDSEPEQTGCFDVY